jgi:arylsulfatase A-like enzyme
MLLAASVALGQGGCSKDPRSEKSNVVIFLVDSLRAQRLGIHGYHRPTSPHIDALGGSGVVFEQASAAAPWTLPSVASLLLSEFPCEHGLLVDYDRIGSGEEPLAMLLKKNGYRTASFFVNPYVGRMSGLDRGYEESELVKEAVDARRIESWLNSLDERPFFLYIHNVEPHNPEEVPDRHVASFGRVGAEVRSEIDKSLREYRRLTRLDFMEKRPLGATDNSREQEAVLERLSQLKEDVNVLYDAAVRQADERVGGVIQALKRAKVWDQTLFILLSDHGEELGDRGGWQHDQSLYEELVHVPLIIRFPGDGFAGRRVSQPVSLIDVAPTILDFLGLAPGPRHRGRSLLAFDFADSPGGGIRMTAFRHNMKKFYRPYKKARGDVNVALRWGRWKAIWNVELDSLELYDLARDPGEMTDVSSQAREISEALRELAKSELTRCYERGVSLPRDTGEPLDEETLRQLESLGYIDRR